MRTQCNTRSLFALRARRVDVLTASDCAMINRGDEDHLRHASNDTRALYSFNIRDYTLLHEQWIARGQAHSGIILARQQRYSIGEQLRRLLHLLNRTPAAEMFSRLEYLGTQGQRVEM